MSLPEPLEQALDHFRHAHRSGCLAHAYLIHGDPAGLADRFATQAACCLLCPAERERPCGTCHTCSRIEHLNHPDYFRIEPEKKTRVIGVDNVRRLIRELQQSSYEGGWKIAAIRFADRMNEAAANAFLKTLEEPPERTLLLLLTRSLDSLLPTILSRCQLIHLAEPKGKRQQSWTRSLDELLALEALEDPLIQHYFARTFTEIISRERKQIEQDERPSHPEDTAVEKDQLNARIEARVRQIRLDMLEAILLWQRDLLLLVCGASPDTLHHRDAIEQISKQAAKLDLTRALQRVRAIDEMHRRLERLSRPEPILIESGLALMA